MPAKDFWSLVVYDPQTRSELQTSQPLLLIREIIPWATTLPVMPSHMFFIVPTNFLNFFTYPGPFFRGAITASSATISVFNLSIISNPC